MNYTWFNDSTDVGLQGQATSVSVDVLTNVANLSSGNTSKGENWTCQVFAYDGYVNSTVHYNDSVVILNSLPTI